MKKMLITAIGAIAVLLALTTPLAAQPAGFCTTMNSCFTNEPSVCTTLTGCETFPPDLLPLANTWANIQTYNDDQVFAFDISAGSLKLGATQDAWISYDGSFDMLTVSTGQTVGTYFVAMSPTATATNYGGAAFFSEFGAGVTASTFIIGPDLNTSTNAMDGSDTWKMLQLDPGNHSDQDHTGVGNEFDGLAIDPVTSPDADAKYHAITVGNGWDYTLVASVLASVPPAPTNSKQVGFYIDEAIDRGAGTATADCALVATLQDATEVVVTVLVTDGVCP